MSKNLKTSWARMAVAICLLGLTGCSLPGSSNGDDKWAYATSTAVLGKTVDELEARLGPAAIKNMSDIAKVGGLAFNIGKCQVAYVTIDQKVTLVSVKVDHDCPPSLDGVPLIKGVPFKPGTTFATMPPALTGTWRGNCFAEHCAGMARIDFVHLSQTAEDSLDIFLTSTINTKERMAVNMAWGESIVRPVSTYSAERDKQAICGTADQSAATRILRDLEITWVNFGYRTKETHWGACDIKSNAPVSVSMTEADTRLAQNGPSGNAPPSTSPTANTGHDTRNTSSESPVPPSEIGGATYEMKYAEVRKRLIAAGYKPVPRPQNQFCGYSEACKLPETDSCAGAGDGACNYYFQKGQQTIRVRGIGDFEGQPQGQIVTAIMRTNASATNTHVIPKQSPHSLVGAWVITGNSCESGDGVIYRADGTFGTVESEGRWRLEGNYLISSITEEADMDGNFKRVSRPVEHRSTIRFVTANQFESRWSDGSAHRLSRCID